MQHDNRGSNHSAKPFRQPAMSKFCLIVDASCDIPASFNTTECLRILPTRISVAGTELMDTRDPVQTLAFYSKYLHDSDATSGKSDALSEDQMIATINRAIATNFDEALGVFVSSERSPIYQRAKRAAARARFETLPARLAVGKVGPIQADCVDSTALFAGYGAQVLDLLDLATKGAGMAEVLARQIKIAPQTYAYAVPGDVDFILQRAAQKGEKSVSALAGFAAKTLFITPILRGHRNKTEPVGRKFGVGKARDAMLDMVTQLVEHKSLLSPHVALSFSGQLDEVHAMPGYARLLDSAAKAMVQVHLSQMSITAAINVGPQSLSVGFIAKEHTFA
jgi:fatty acid-binding protein DegV